MPKLNEDIEHQIDLRMLRDIIKIARQLNISSAGAGEPDGEGGSSPDIDKKIKMIGKLAALAAVGAIKDPAIRLRAMPIIRGL